MVENLKPASSALIEDIERGLHPFLIGEVLKLLREYAEETTTQIVFTTHSPMVISELYYDEVSIVSHLLESGTTVSSFRSTPEFEEFFGAHKSGKFWMAPTH
jgi:predicted ATPase